MVDVVYLFAVLYGPFQVDVPIVVVSRSRECPREVQRRFQDEIREMV